MATAALIALKVIKPGETVVVLVDGNIFFSSESVSKPQFTNESVSRPQFINESIDRP